MGFVGYTYYVLWVGDCRGHLFDVLNSNRIDMVKNYSTKYVVPFESHVSTAVSSNDSRSYDVFPFPAIVKGLIQISLGCESGVAYLAADV